jgi:hypothetical protein
MSDRIKLLSLAAIFTDAAAFPRVTSNSPPGYRVAAAYGVSDAASAALSIPRDILWTQPDQPEQIMGVREIDSLKYEKRLERLLRALLSMVGDQTVWATRFQLQCVPGHYQVFPGMS